MATSFPDGCEISSNKWRQGRQQWPSVSNLSNWHRYGAMLYLLGGWVWTAESAQPLIFGYSCSLHPSSALVRPLLPLLGCVPTTKASGWTPWAQEATTLCFFPTSPCSTESVKSFLQQKIQILLLAQSFAYTQRRTNSTICCSGERIRLCLLFPNPTTNVLTIFWKSLLENYNHSNTQVFRFCLFSIENSNTVRHNGNRRLQPSENYLWGCFLVLGQGSIYQQSNPQSSCLSDRYCWGEISTLNASIRALDSILWKHGI